MNRKVAQYPFCDLSMQEPKIKEFLPTLTYPIVNFELSRSESQPTVGCEFQSLLWYSERMMST